MPAVENTPACVGMLSAGGLLPAHARRKNFNEIGKFHQIECDFDRGKPALETTGL